jgi:hypothetical protein
MSSPYVITGVLFVVALVLVAVLFYRLGGGGGIGWQNFFIASGPFIAFLLVALAFVAILASVFWPYVVSTQPKTLLQQLAETDTARGLITFLVAVSTVGIALTLIVWVASTGLGLDVVKERSAFSKEVLTSLIGILGTIIGFYFGATQGQMHGPGTQTTLSLANLSITPPKPGKDETVTLHATFYGGQPPYSYAIRFTPDTIKEIDGQSSNGAISQIIKLDTYDPAKPLDITLEGSDAAGTISGNRIHLAAMAAPPNGTHDTVP